MNSLNIYIKKYISSSPNNGYWLICIIIVFFFFKCFVAFKQRYQTKSCIHKQNIPLYKSFSLFSASNPHTQKRTHPHPHTHTDKHTNIPWLLYIKVSQVRSFQVTVSSCVYLDPLTPFTITTRGWKRSIFAPHSPLTGSGETTIPVPYASFSMSTCHYF